MNLEILSPTSSLFSGSVKSVTVPSVQGPFTMLHNHAPIVALLQKGLVRLETEEGDKKEFEIESGFVEQHDNTIIVCVEM